MNDRDTPRTHRHYTPSERISIVREVEDLRLQVRNLERLLGQRTLEVALLKERLGKAIDDGAMASSNPSGEA